MSYILYKTDGNKFVTVEDATLDNRTSLTFVGRNYAGYGEYVNENFLYLLENFTSTMPPESPIQGQLWFDNSIDSRKLNVCYDGNNFKSIANLTVGSSVSNPTVGDLLWNTSTSQLSAFDGSEFLTIGPQYSAQDKSRWESISLATQQDTTITVPVLKADVVYNNVVVISNETFTPADNTLGFDKIHAGITLPGANSITGSSQKNDGSTEYLFWGTAADAKTANTASSVVISTVTSGLYYLPLVNNTTGTVQVKANTSLTYTAQTGVLNATATSAQYADIAEKYAADRPYETGTVLVIGGVKEVTTTAKRADTSVIGIVSQSPAFMMNSEAGIGPEFPYIALRGRVPCKVTGTVRRGDLLVTSRIPGHAEAAVDGDHPSAVVGKALQDNNERYAIIEVLVV